MVGGWPASELAIRHVLATDGQAVWSLGSVSGVLVAAVQQVFLSRGTQQGESAVPLGVFVVQK